MRPRTVFAAIALTALLISGCGGSSNDGSSGSDGSTNSDGSGDLAARLDAQYAVVKPFVGEVVRDQKVTKGMVAALLAQIAVLPPDQQQDTANLAKGSLRELSSGAVSGKIERDVYRRAVALIGEAQKGLAGGQP